MNKLKATIVRLYGGGYTAYLKSEVGGKSFSKEKACDQAIKKLEEAIAEFKRLAKEKE